MEQTQSLPGEQVAPVLDGKVPAIARDGEPPVQISLTDHTTLIPWKGYYFAYFAQALIMSMLLTNVPVFLRQALALDWLALTASFVVMLSPILLRPVLGWGMDRHPQKLPLMTFGGTCFIIAGGIAATIGATTVPSGTAIIILGLFIAVIGATFLNVSADCHILRVVPLASSAKVNARKRISAFVGIGAGQIFYLALIGGHYSEIARWAWYFTLPVILTLAGYGLTIIFTRSWRIFPDIAIQPLQRNKPVVQSPKGRPTPFLIVFLLLLSFLFNLPDGLIEPTFENYIVDVFGSDAWVLYSATMILGGISGAAGYFIAGRKGQGVLERDLLWFIPVAIGYYLILRLVPSFPVVLLLTIGVQVTGGYIQVRLLQAWQARVNPKNPGLTFQVYFVTFQAGRIVGALAAGPIMMNAAYAGIFTWCIIIWIVLFALSVAYSEFLKRHS